MSDPDANPPAPWALVQDGLDFLRFEGPRRVIDEVTESTIANVVVETEGRRVTPPVFSGLLPGVERAHLLAKGDLREAVVPVSTLRPGQRLWLANSVRGLVPAEYVRALRGTRNQKERTGTVA